MMAGIGAGIYRDVEEAASIAQVARRHEPDPEAHRRYRELYALYRQLYRQLGDAWWQRHRILQQFQPGGETTGGKEQEDAQG